MTIITKGKYEDYINKIALVVKLLNISLSDYQMIVNMRRMYLQQAEVMRLSDG